MNASIQRRGRNNPAAVSWVEDLTREYADVPEAQEWITSHLLDLKSPNVDGSYPLPERCLDRNDFKSYSE